MKNLPKILIAIFMCVISFGILSACGGNKIVSAVIKAGTFESTILLNEEMNTEDIVVVFKYSDGKTKEVGESELTFSEIDTSRLETQTLTITYGKYSFEVKIKIVATEAEVNSIHLLESQLLKDFNSNKSEKALNTSNNTKPNEFYDRNQLLYVGDDNTFDFRINASGTSASGELVRNLHKVKTIVTVEIKEDGAWELLTGAALTAMVTVNDVDAKLDFTEAAVNREFRVTVQASNRTEGYEEAATKFTAILNVIDGFNVYTAKELSVYDNTPESSGYWRIDWTPIKTEMGLLGVEPDTIILQNNIFITREDVPSDMFWKQGDADYATMQALTDQTLEGSLKDDYNLAIYKRLVANGKAFSFIGNYFSVDVSTFPKMVAEANKKNGIKIEGETQGFMTAHTTVFFNRALDESTTTAGTKVMWKNLMLIGNGALDDNPLNSGSILQMKNNTVNFSAYNTITNNFYLTYLLEAGEVANDNNGHFLIDQCKGYNSFCTLLYAWGTKDLVIKDSEFVGAGGPAMIADHIWHESNGDGGSASNIDFISTRIESFVSGKEPWFAMYPGTSQMVGDMTMLDAFFDGSAGLSPTAKTVIKDKVLDNEILIPRINAIVAMKTGGDFSMNPQRIQGRVNMFETMLDYEKHYGLNDQTQETTTYGLNLNKGQSLMDKAFANTVYIESSGNGGYINQGFGSINQDSSIMSGIPFDVGNYLNIYTPLGIGVMIQLNDRPAA